MASGPFRREATRANGDNTSIITDCILETITSILSEIQEQNNEYNWDPLTFVFTAIIGIIAIIFAALTAFQALLTAGSGRTKSGAYAIGPWSKRNHRKFDWAEMRCRTTSSTPILTVDLLNLNLLENPQEGSSCHNQDLKRFKKGQEDYFPATWLALLTHLSLDNTELWEVVKLTGADHIPSEFSAVPAYGSIGFVATLAMILSRGFGRLTIDQESGLPRVCDRRFNLIFRQHPLLGAIGFFEMYGKMASQDSGWHSKIHGRLLQAHDNVGNNKLHPTSTAISWAKSVIGPDIDELELGEKAYALCSTYLQKSPTQESEYKDECIKNQHTLREELKSIDLWLKQTEPYVLCRMLTLSPILEAPSHTENATVHYNPHGALSRLLNGKLGYFLDAIGRPNSFDCLYSVGWTYAVQSRMAVRRDTFEGLTKIRDLWQMGELSLKDEASGGEDRADGSQEHKSPAWKLPHATLHPLDDLLIYRVVLMTLLYSLSSDSSDLIDEDSYRLIVPMM
ncbi:hypothetical protein F53441_2866 [Fusarium austroafricanum]|uniref:Uncharacterized protein n=1 Tax=Fusarium austroafricanum TaxID=2364996 RepID=A0A8H4KQS4_9HYPO|nr:hypothetical protein F53441_2866 [Fusarium austroafricanum]